MLHNSVLRGAAAGAAGTVALNIATYMDMAIRGRASSDVPAQVAGALTQAVGLDPQAKQDGQRPVSDEEKAKAKQRLSGLGALMGYATGLGVGALYGLARPHLARVSWPLAGLALGAAAMAGSDVPATVTGATDPRGWGASGWLSDIVPHVLYGLVTVVAYDAFTGE
ncbi:MAG: hypothetical protein ACRDHE_08300 [Ktedonobacterales bacterium]